MRRASSAVVLARSQSVGAVVRSFGRSVVRSFGVPGPAAAAADDAQLDDDDGERGQEGEEEGEE